MMQYNCTIPIPLNEPFSNDAVTPKRVGMNNEVLQDIHDKFDKQGTAYCCNYLSTNTAKTYDLPATLRDGSKES